jgi:branched-chain amino acid transport system ATP-binding protein
LLEVSNVKISYGDYQAVHNATFDVKEGEIVSIIGSNGSGKTTLVNCLSGLVRCASGSIVFNGRHIEREPPHVIVKLGLVQIPEGRKIFPGCTVNENLRLGSYLPEAKSKRQETMEEVFRLFPILKERKDQKAGTLSGGEQQMLALGRGLMSRPRLVVMDEPSLGLAPLMMDHLFQKIDQINRAGSTILLIEQNTFHALKSCDRAFIMENGNITLEGEGEQLLKDPAVIEAYLGI